MNGLLVVDKPGGLTSRDVVNRVQRWFPRGTKVGHTGTLDPLATGVLVVCVGAATRLADYVQAMGKSYASRFRLGATSTTDDADGEVTETAGAVPPAREQVEGALAGFVGAVDQTPPAFSAVKVAGERAYDLARLKKGVQLGARRVWIQAARLGDYEWPFADVEVDCGKGTYIRSIARDLGAKLGCGGLVQALRRTRVGPFTVEQGVGPDAIPEQAKGKLLPMVAAVADMPQVRVGAADAARLRQGQRVRLCPESWVRPAEFDPAGVAVLNEAGELIGSGAVKRGDLWPKLMFPA